jgi:hypothetical protein
MKKRTGFSLAALAMAVLLLCQFVPAAFAQDQDYPPDQGPNGNYQQDPPTRAGRISMIEGSVSFQPQGQGDWVDAVRNRPLTVGDNLWVDQDSRAELQIGSTSIELGPQTSVTFLDLGNQAIQLRLSLGSLFFRVRRFDADDTFEVDTPNLAFNVNRPGEFRLDVNQNGDQTVASVFRGEGEITGSGNSYRLSEGQQGTFSGTEELTYDVGELPPPDDFSDWAMRRNDREDHFRSSRYVSSDMTGYDDLDEYGRWREVPDYGYVWTPVDVPYGWAPYRYGHWAYVYPWGWTWVEDEPWGFAPFHYGRWAFVEGGWCWVPGPVEVHPVYAPALVAFVGGGGFAVGGAVGWFPLAPGEVFVPWYRTSPTYVQNVNVTNTHVTVVQVNNVYNNYTVNKVTNVTYVNQRVTNSVTVVNHETFVNARPVNQNVMHVNAREMQTARVTPAVVNQVQPQRQSILGKARPVQFHPPAQALTRPVVATRQPVVYNRPNTPAAVRPAAPPPVKTVRAAPPNQAQPLQRGARGGPAANAPGRPAPENRGVAPRPGAPAAQPGRPGQTENRNVPRPGAPANAVPPARPNQGAPRPGAPEYRPAQPENRPAPQQNRPAPPENRPAPPENRNVPHPPSAAPQAPERENPSPRPSENRQNENRPPQVAPESSRRPQGPDARQPEPSRAPEVREQPAPRPSETRQAPPAQAERNVPRPEARPAEPPRENRAPAPHDNKPKDNQPPKSKSK